MPKPVFIVVNPYCHQGRGWKRWLSIKDEVRRRLPDAREIIIEKNINLIAVLEDFHWRDEPCYLISAGGDGSMHHLINAVTKQNSLDFSAISFGAIGLGSSNDFLKPFYSRIGKIPTRINTSLPAVWHDLGKAQYITTDNMQAEKYFIVNASFGATAEGNWNFNNPGKFLQKLKKYNTDIAIAYTAIATILFYKNRPCNILYKNEKINAVVSNINILKIPYVSGSFHYRQNIRPNDGQLGLNICLSMNKLELLQTLIELGSGKFKISDKKISVFTQDFKLTADSPVVFECDGETEMAKEVNISIVKNAVRVLTN